MEEGRYQNYLYCIVFLITYIIIIISYSFNPSIPFLPGFTIVLDETRRNCNRNRNLWRDGKGRGLSGQSLHTVQRDPDLSGNPVNILRRGTRRMRTRAVQGRYIKCIHTCICLHWRLYIAWMANVQTTRHFWTTHSDSAREKCIVLSLTVALWSLRLRSLIGNNNNNYNLRDLLKVHDLLWAYWNLI